MSNAETPTVALDAAFFTSILDENRDAVRASVKEALLAGVKRQFEWEIPDAVKREVSAFVTEEVIPEIRAELMANKAAFVSAATDIAKAAPIELAKAMQEAVAKNLANSWTLKKVVEELVR